MSRGNEQWIGAAVGEWGEKGLVGIAREDDCGQSFAAERDKC